MPGKKNFCCNPFNLSGWRLWKDVSEISNNNNCISHSVENVCGTKNSVLLSDKFDNNCVNNCDEISETESGSVSSSSASLPGSDNEEYVEGDEGKEMLAEVMKQFQKADSYFEKMHCLTMVPPSWSVNKIKNTFKVSHEFAKKGKLLQSRHGFGSYPVKKTWQSLSETDLSKVTLFYYSDEISRLLPGIKDCVSVKDDMTGKRILKQKRLVLCNLREAYILFKELHQDLKLGFTKFTELRPKECILADHCGSHNVCVCKVHQNFKLMFQQALKSISQDFSISSYHELLNEMLCEHPTLSCHLLQCKKCPGFSNISIELTELFRKHSIENVSYQQWTNTDHCSVETITQDWTTFLATFKKNSQKLIQHHFISKNQSGFLKNLKMNLKSGEFLVIGDFAQNYSPIIQDAIQNHYWSNNQITVHPFVVYRSEFDENDQSKYDTFVIISECTTHNAVAVSLFIKKLMNKLIAQYGKNCIKKIYYFSDGAASQYKNKSNFINLVYHAEDFHGIKAEWHFFATSHGKNACDGVGGTVKRYEARESLRRPSGDLILTAKNLFDLVSSGIKSIKFEFCTLKEHEEQRLILVDRFQQAIPIKGTQSFHSFIPTANFKIKCNIISSFEELEGTLCNIVTS